MEQSATKDWQTGDNWDRVTQESYTLGPTPFITAFTNSGKWRRAGFCRMKAIGVAIAMAALSGTAIANPHIGPTSSASMGISLSVASRFELKANPTETALGFKSSGPTSFCMATNGSPTLLPITLVWIEDRQVAPQPAERLSWCAWKDGPPQAGRGDRTGAILIRPE
jgi:hypothetical protein